MRYEYFPDYLGEDQLEEGALYLIVARNASIGVWDRERKCFVIARSKFGSVFLDDESHYDTGAPYGTVKPIKLLAPGDQAPHGKAELLEYLQAKQGEGDWQKILSAIYIENIKAGRFSENTV